MKSASQQPHAGASYLVPKHRQARDRVLSGGHHIRDKLDHPVRDLPLEMAVRKRHLVEDALGYRVQRQGVRVDEQQFLLDAQLEGRINPEAVVRWQAFAARGATVHLPTPIAETR